MDTNPNIVEGAEESVKPSMFLPKKTFKFVVWNTVDKRDDNFTIEISVLGKETPEQLVQQAKFKAINMIADRKAYEGQKIRSPGEPK